MAPLVVGLSGLVNLPCVREGVQGFYRESARHVNTKSARVYNAELTLWMRLGCIVWVQIDRPWSHLVGIVEPKEGAIEWIRIHKPFGTAAGKELAQIARGAWWFGNTAPRTDTKGWGRSYEEL